jgi:hypothetical protein
MRRKINEPWTAEKEARFSEFLRKVGERIAEREALNPTPRPPPEPWVDKPGTLIAAEKDLWHWQMCHKLQSLLCRDVAKCEDGRCRRVKRCRELEHVAIGIEACRVRLAAEQAKWQPPLPPSPPRGRGKKGRAAARP